MFGHPQMKHEWLLISPQKLNIATFHSVVRERLVVDLKQTSLGTQLPINVSDSPVLKKIRKSSPPEKGTYRLVLELKSRVDPQLFKLAPIPGGQYGHRLVIDMPHTRSSSVPNTSKSSVPRVSRDASQLLGTADIVVAIDAGHGGEDPGSIGPSRKYEKHATLAISRKLLIRSTLYLE